MTGREKRLSFLIDPSKYTTTQCESDYFAIFEPAGICIGKKSQRVESMLFLLIFTVSQDYAELFLNIIRRHHQHELCSQRRQKARETRTRAECDTILEWEKITHDERDREWKWGNFLIITCFHSIKKKKSYIFFLERNCSRARDLHSRISCAPAMGD